MTRPESLLSFRKVPPAIYLALAISVASTLVLVIATLLTTGESYERFSQLQRWYLLDAGCDVASTLLVTLGLLELARRHVGPPRVMTQVGAWLGLLSVSWIAVRSLVVLFKTSPEHQQLVYDWSGRGSAVLLLAAAVLLTIGADAWRRTPLAAALLVLVAATSFSMPVIGKELWELIGRETGPRQLYALARVALYAVGMVFVAASLAGHGLDSTPEPRSAAAGFRLARGALVFRLLAAVLIAVIVVGGRSEGAAKVVAVAGPAVAVIAMTLFAIGLQRAAGAGLHGMPRLLLSLGAALTLWWGTIQLEQMMELVNALRDGLPGRRVMETMAYFSIAGPITATLGLALVGSAVASYAGNRGDLELRTAATGRTITFLLLTLGSIGLQAQLAKATSLGSALGIILFAAIAAIVALAVLVGLLDRAADSLDRLPEIPPARVL